MNEEQLQLESAQIDAELGQLLTTPQSEPKAQSQPQPVESQAPQEPQLDTEPPPEKPVLQGEVRIEQSKNDEGFNLLDFLKDILTGVFGGVRNAVQNTGSLAHDLAGGDYQTTLAFGSPSNENEEKIVEESPFKIPGVVTFVPGDLAKKYDFKSPQILDLPEVEQPKSIAGQMTQGVTQFATGFVGGSRFLQGVGWAKGAVPLVRSATAGAVSDFTVFDGNEERLSNLVEQFPALHNPVTDYMKADPKDSEAEGRLKNVLEGLMLGGSVELLTKLVKQVKTVRHIRQTKGDAEAASYLAKHADELDKVLKQSDDELIDYLMGGRIKDKRVKVETVDPSSMVKEVAEKQATKIPRNTQPLTEEQISVFRQKLQEARDSGKPLDILVDFNADTMVTGKEVKQVLDTLSAVNKEEIFKLKGGKQSLDEIEYKAVQILENESKEVADLLGTDANNLIAAIGRDAKNADEQAARLVAGKQLMQSMARKISDVATLIDSGKGTDGDQLELLRHIDILSDLEANLKAVQTGTARTVSAGRIRTGDVLFDEDIAEILDQVGGSDNVRKLARRIKAAGKDGGMYSVIQVVRKGWLGKLIDVHNEVWMNSVLSGPKTHAINVLSTAANTVFLPGERIIGGALARDKDAMIEGAATYFGLKKALGDSLNMAWRSLQMEDNALDPLGRMWDADSRKAISASNLGIQEGSILAPAVNWLGGFTRLSGRFLMAEDEFFKQINYRASVYAKAVREGMGRGYEGQQLGEFVENTFRQAFDNEGRATFIDPLKYAREATFTQELTDDTFLGALGNTIQKGVNRHPLVGRAIFPFIRVPTNLMRFVVDRMPFIAPLTNQFKTDIAAGGLRRSQAMGRLATGSALYTYATMLALEGKITGSGPSSPDLRKQKQTTGWQPYSFVETLPDGSKKYTPFNRTDPFGMFFGLVADFSQTTGQNNDETNEDLATALVLSMANNINNKAYFKGLVDTMSLLGWNNYNQEGSAQNLIESRLASYIPNSLQMVRNDPYLRETRSWMDRINNKLGFGASTALDPKRNMFGEAIELPAGYGAFDIQPFVSSTTKPDPVLDELAKLSEQGVAFSLPANKINEGRIDLTTFKNAQGQTAADRRRELMGASIKGHPTLKEKFAQIMASPQYQNASISTDDFEGGKANRLKRVYEQYKQAGLRQLLNEDFKDGSGRSLNAAYEEDRRNAIRALRGLLEGQEQQ